MSLLGALGGQLLLFALALLLMRVSLRGGGSKGLFAALPLGMLPSLIVATGIFWQVQDKADPEMLAIRRAFNTQVELKAAQGFPGPEDSAKRESYRREVLQAFEVVPAFMFSFHLLLLAAMAVFLRRRYAGLGLLPAAEPLLHWTAPWALVWLIIGPVLFLAGKTRGLFEVDEVWSHAAWNILGVGLTVVMFQGAVVFAAKIKGWWGLPQSRVLVFLVLGGIFLSLLLQNILGLLAFLLLTGLFEPWVDARRLRRPPPEPELKS